MIKNERNVQNGKSVLSRACLNFMNYTACFFRYIGSTGTGFMTGVKSVRSMELRQIVSGAADVPVLERMIRKKFWH